MAKLILFSVFMRIKASNVYLLLLCNNRIGNHNGSPGSEAVLSKRNGYSVFACFLIFPKSYIGAFYENEVPWTQIFKITVCKDKSHHINGLSGTSEKRATFQGEKTAEIGVKDALLQGKSIGFDARKLSFHETKP